MEKKTVTGLTIDPYSSDLEEISITPRSIVEKPRYGVDSNGTDRQRSDIQIEPVSRPKHTDTDYIEIVDKLSTAEIMIRFISSVFSIGIVMILTCGVIDTDSSRIAFNCIGAGLVLYGMYNAVFSVDFHMICCRKKTESN
jgi:hypothetical protein